MPSFAPGTFCLWHCLTAVVCKEMSFAMEYSDKKTTELPTLEFYHMCVSNHIEKNLSYTSYTPLSLVTICRSTSDLMAV